MPRPSVLLGVPRGASAAEIKTRWRLLVAEFHPDRHPGQRAEFEERFKTLSDAHDRLLAGDDRDLSPAVRGRDLTMVLPVPFMAALLGERVDALTPDGRALVVKLPLGALSGQQLRVPGRGGPGNPNGDLLLQLLVLPDPVYTRRPDSLTLERTQIVTWLAAWRGDTVEVATPWGPTWIDLRPRTHSGQVYEIPAHGVRTERGPKHWGALRLSIALDAPPHPEMLSQAARTALEEALEAAYAEVPGEPEKKNEGDPWRW